MKINQFVNLYQYNFKLNLTVLCFPCAVAIKRLLVNCEDIFWKINLEQSVGIHKNNLDCKRLKSYYRTHLNTLFFLIKT